MNSSQNQQIALALGSGSARGLAHIGVIQRLLELNIQANIICGTSAGSMIGAIYALGKLEEFSRWICDLNNSEVLHYLNIGLPSNGGFASASRLIEHLRNQYGDPNIEDLPCHLAAVSTNLLTGQEVWHREGKLWDAVRASMAIPGLISPHKLNGKWLVDGGLVNPVPVSVCRAMEADIIIAVNLNGDMVGRAAARAIKKETVNEPIVAPLDYDQDIPVNDATEPNLFARWSASLREKTDPIINDWFSPVEHGPSLSNVVANSINIMQDRITRSRLAGEPADLLLNPLVSEIGLLEFNRGREAIAEGRACVDRHIPQLEYLLGKQLTAASNTTA